MIGLAVVLAVAVPMSAAGPVAGPVAGADRVHAEIMAAMADSAAGWNAGDLDRFMRVYSDAPDTSFVAKDGLVTGKAAIAARYRPRFTPEGAAKRGMLSFETLRFTPIDARHALLVARYRLRVAGVADQTGPTTLLFVRERGGWRIAADHSS
ncbi:DUF4440 domain-containing protein [Sphingomonas aliaeris]|uniref:DUF4440 domain-containing protein n=1 Tax=Sphingomonas aliaeris TaxID=2759526 RepID=A0A974NSZ0_9SPHN|nr:DUF4440 domain-containing protein [Sphingomonas aliaeris]QQV76238.1 DUF4440 domain-containing protein [Sphingomonas aliaeris]